MATKADLAQLATQLEARMATKADLAQLATQLEAKMATKADLAHVATQMAYNLDLWGGALFERLLTELARHTRASQEAMSTQISTFDDKYAALPARVSHLETGCLHPSSADRISRRAQAPHHVAAHVWRPCGRSVSWSRS